MIPYLKDGNWDAGMVAGVRAVCGRLDGSMVNDTDDEEDISFFGILAAVIGFFVVAGGIGWMAARAASKCPNCGHKIVRRKQSYDENYRGGGGGGPVIFGGGGSFGGGGGGFSGGSFGGGMGGGGGAGSRF